MTVWVGEMASLTLAMTVRVGEMASLTLAMTVGVRGISLTAKRLGYSLPYGCTTTTSMKNTSPKGCPLGSNACQALR